MLSEGWLEGGERKFLTPKANVVETVVWKRLEAVMRVFNDPTQEMPLLVFCI
jgi:hypothetical protein